MKLSLCTWSYHRTLEAKKLTLEGLLKVAANELKLGGVDIIADHLPKTDKKYLTSIKKLATDLQLSIACLSPGNNFGKPTQGERDAEVEGIKKWIDAAVILGAPALRIFAGWPGGADKAKELWNPMVDCMKKCVPYAQEAGVTLAVEPHNGGGYLPDSDSTLKLIKDVNSDWLKINLDTGNYHDKDIYKGIERTISLAPHIHAKIHKITKEGKELEFDYDKIFAIFKSSGYRGFLSIEYEGQEDEQEYIPIAVDMLKRYAEKYKV